MAEKGSGTAFLIPRVLPIIAVVVLVIVFSQIGTQGSKVVQADSGSNTGDCNAACTFLKQQCMEQARDLGKQCEKACPETKPRSVEKCKQECKKDADAYKETCKKQEKICKGNCPCNPDNCNPAQGDECSKASCKDTTITAGSRSFTLPLCVFETNQGACCGKEKPRKTCDELRACRTGICEEDQPPPPPPQDGDGDGIPDDNDQCPDQPGPADNNGCPIGCEQGSPCAGTQDCSGMLCSLQSGIEGIEQTEPSCKCDKNCVQNSYTEQELPFAATCDGAKSQCCSGNGQEQPVINGCFAFC